MGLKLRLAHLRLFLPVQETGRVATKGGLQFKGRNSAETKGIKGIAEVCAGSAIGNNHEFKSQ